MGLFSLLLWQVGIAPITKAFSSVAWAWVMVRVLLHLAGLVLQAIRWHLLLRGLGIPASWRVVFLRNWTARFFSMALPSQLGGDAYRVFGGVGVPARKRGVATSIVLDRLIGLVALCGMVVVVGVVKFGYTTSAGLTLLPLLALGGVVLASPWIFAQWPSDLGGRLVQHLPSRVRQPLHKVLQELSMNTSQKKVLALALATSVSLHVVSTLASYASFRALGVDVPLVAVMLLMPMVNLVSQIPISLNGLGVREGAFTIAFAVVHVASADAVAVALFSRVINVSMAGVGALIHLGHTLRLPSPSATPSRPTGTEPAR